MIFIVSPHAGFSEAGVSRRVFLACGCGVVLPSLRTAPTQTEATLRPQIPDACSPDVGMTAGSRRRGGVRLASGMGVTPKPPASAESNAMLSYPWCGLVFRVHPAVVVCCCGPDSAPRGPSETPYPENAGEPATCETAKGKEARSRIARARRRQEAGVERSRAPAFEGGDVSAP